MKNKTIVLQLIVVFWVLLGCSLHGGNITVSDDQLSQPKTASDETIELDLLVERNGKHYKVNSELPFTGTATASYPDGQKKSKATYKDGKLEGTQTSDATPTPEPSPTLKPIPIPLTDIEMPTENEKAASIDKKITVFGIKVFALNGVTSRDLKLVANVLAQWIDNDEDGTPDNPAVLAEIVKHNSRMILGVTFDQIGPWHNNSQRMLKDVHAPTYGLDVTSINHNWYGLPLSNYSQDHYRTDGLSPPDAATEETFHLITDIGYANVYPSVFWHGEPDHDNASEALRSYIAKHGEEQKNASLLTVAMDNARGGHFERPPKQYPDNAWYTRSDNCGYKCFVGEYIHWGMISLLGYNETRGENIQSQWQITNVDSLRKRDPALYGLLTNPEYRFAERAPDGSYGD